MVTDVCAEAGCIAVTNANAAIAIMRVKWRNELIRWVVDFIVTHLS